MDPLISVRLQGRGLGIGRRVYVSAVWVWVVGMAGSVLAEEMQNRHSLGGSAADEGRVAVLTVIPDLPPTGLLEELGVGTTGVVARFSESATDNKIAPGTLDTFDVDSYVLEDIGDPSSPGSISVEDDEINLTSSGTGSQADSDQLTFAGRLVSGDFDIRVCVVSVELGDLWGGGGLMARANTDTNSAFAAIYATPGSVGCYFQYRSTPGNIAYRSGYFPANHPYTWLRLRRSGDELTAYAGIDGTAWTWVGEATVELPDDVHIGLVALSADAEQSTTARFRDFGDVTSPTVVSVAELPFEPMGPSSRNTALVISEIMYHPTDDLSTSSLEYIELHNTDGVFIDLGGFRLDGDIQYTFADGTLLPAGGYLVVARLPAALEAAYGISGVAGPYARNLPNDQGVVRVLNELGGTMLEVEYGSFAPWPAAADGTGHSLALRRPSYGENDPRAWGQSDQVHGSPGRYDGVGVDPLGALRINEFLAHTDDPELDRVELYNASPSPLVLDGVMLSDQIDEDRFVIPAGTTLPGRGFLVYDENQLGFAFGAGGGWIIVKNPTGTRVLDAVQYRGQENGISTGRYPDGAASMRRLHVPTFGSPNARIAVSPVGINEIMAHPITEEDDDQFVELHNNSADAVDISGWAFVDGISFEFPEGTSIPGGGYLVVARNRERMLSSYPGLSAGLVFGDFGGRLSHGSERLSLARPEEVTRVEGSQVVTEFIEVVVDEVTYVLGGRWGKWADGGGSSLELIDPFADKQMAPNWADSDETGKAPWTLVEATRQMEQGSGTANRFEMMLQGAGECLVDEVECRQSDEINRISNPGFEVGAAGWVGQGTHHHSVHTTSNAYAGTGSLHLIASGRGDTGPNKLRTSISSLATSQPATLRARARWLKGDPYLLLRVRGNWIEASQRLEVPTNLGTPGAVNSRRVDNAPPAVADVSHAPIHPAAGEPVRVTTRIDDPDGLSAATLTYRLDPSTSTIHVPMRDDGTAGDALAGDGIYSAEIPGQSGGVMAAFFIQAVDSGGRSARFPAQAPAEGLIRFGDETAVGGLGIYHAWCTQETIDTWSNREKNSNDPLDCTFTYGASRVIYNANILYSGSPFHTPNYTGPLGFPCDYEMEFPSDDLFLGIDDFVLLVQNPLFNHFFLPDPTVQAEATAYWIGRKLGQPYNHKRYVFMFLNGQFRPRVYEDTQQPNADLLKVYFPDHPAARLHKIEDWFEFDDSGSAFSYQTATLLNYTLSSGDKNLARYRWNWRPRAGTEPNDFSSLYALVDVAGSPSPEPYTSRTQSLIDMQSWLSCIAVHHIVGDWDSYGYRRGKNMFAYKPGQGPWRLMLWDLDFALGAASGDGPTHNLFDTSNEGDPRIARMFSHPPFRRQYLGILQDAAEGPLAPGVADSMLDERYRMLSDHRVFPADPVSIKNYMAVRRSYILSQMPSAAFGVNGGGTRVINGNVLDLAGSAPIEVRGILVNGIPYPVIWTEVTEWSLEVPVASGAQSVFIQAVDRDGIPIDGADRTLSVTSTAQTADPRDWVAINEIMYHPEQPGGAFAEIHNHHPSAAFDLSGWRFNGLDYRFPPGAWIPAGGFQVVAKDRFDYALAYGTLTALTSEYGGNLDPEGETLTLFRPGAIPGTEEVVDRVRYEAAAPWPPLAAQPGTALQLVDASQDNSRVGNWAVGGSIREPRWIRATAIGTATSSSMYIYLASAGELYLDDVSLVAGSQPGAGVNRIANGDFEAPLSGTWNLASNMAGSSRSTEFRRGGQAGLHIVATSGGFSTGTSISQVISPPLSIGETYALSFWYRESDDAPSVVIRLSGSGIRAQVDPERSSQIAATATPAAVNSVASARDPYPPLWLNELQPVHQTGPTNADGDHAPWLELYNAGSNPLSLDGYYLSLSTNNLLDEPFPASAELPGEAFRIVFADGRPDLASPSEWHTAFTLPPSTGLVLLARNGADGPEVVDYLSYVAIPAESSYGDVPDGQPFYRQVMFRATAGASNSGAVAPLEVIISEWLADNSGAGGMVDPVDGNADDWFELFNTGAALADLGGYFLTDDLDTPLKYRIPAGYTIPAGGYLLVWADGEPHQNHPAIPHLHADFRLSADGEAIGLFAPDRTPIDTVTFGAQTEDISEGFLPVPDGPVTSLTPTPGGQNYVTLPANPPWIADLHIAPGSTTLQLDYVAIPGAVYRLETAVDPFDGAPSPLRPDRMAFDSIVTESLPLPTTTHERRIYYIRRTR